MFAACTEQEQSPVAGAMQSCIGRYNALALVSSKVTLTFGDLGLQLIHGSLDPRESALNGILIDSVVFAQFTLVPIQCCV